MRTTFVNTLIDLAEKDERIFLLTGDLGFSIFESYQNKFPKRFLNMGVAEQNMIGVAAGLAMSGKIVVVYSIIPFVTMRCFEQIRNDLCMQNLNVKIIGIGAGLHYGVSGSTHHAIEDIGLLRSLPNISVISPSTREETASSLQAAAKHNGVFYIRLSSINYPDSVNPLSRFSFGKGTLIKDGSDITLISTGAMLGLSEKLTENLQQKGCSVRLVNMACLKPFDTQIVLESAKKTKAIFTIEDHSIIGGLGSATAEILAESENKVIFHCFGFPDAFVKFVGNREYLSEQLGLSEHKIIDVILKKLKLENINA